MNQLLVAPHNPSGPVATVATGHVASTMSNFLILEYAWGEADWRGRPADAARADRGRLPDAVHSPRPGLRSTGAWSRLTDGAAPARRTRPRSSRPQPRVGVTRHLQTDRRSGEHSPIRLPPAAIAGEQPRTRRPSRPRPRSATRSPAHGQVHEIVAPLSHQPPHAIPFTANHQRQRTLEIGLPQNLRPWHVL